MQCISDAAGTPYRDAFSTSELVDSLTETVLDLGTSQNEATQPREPNPTPDTTVPEFALVVETQDGSRQRGAGVLVAADGSETAVESFARHTPVPGDYVLRAGVRLVSGEIYQAVEIPITVPEQGRTIGRVVAPTPPKVSAIFSMEGEELRATVVRVYRDGTKIGSFKGDAWAFVPEGLLEFRSKLSGTSEDTKVTEVFEVGDDKTIRFDAGIEVRLNVFAIAEATGERLKGKPTTELRQNGVKVHTINSHSGGLVRPGTYVLIIDDGLNHFETEMTVTEDSSQSPEIAVPSAALTITYQDASGSQEPSKRVFLRNLETNKRATRSSDTAISLVPGTYRIEGWPKANGYPETEITVVPGDSTAVILKAAN